MSSEKVKYPKTPYLNIPDCKIPGDAKLILESSDFKNKDVCVTIKMDGENTTMYRDCIHARSLDSKNHPSREWIKNYWARIAYKIPENYRVCGENLYAKHSIKYENLRSYFYGFSVWNEEVCLSWLDTVRFFNNNHMNFVDCLYNGPYDEDIIRSRLKIALKLRHEGIVIRSAGSFVYNNFSKNIAKIVRENHVQTDEHWMNKPIEKNRVNVGSEF